MITKNHEIGVQKVVESEFLLSVHQNSHIRNVFCNSITSLGFSRK